MWGKTQHYRKLNGNKKIWVFIPSIDSNGACSLRFYTIPFSVALPTLHLNLSRLGGFFQRVDVAHAWVCVLASLSQDRAIFAMKSCTSKRICFFFFSRGSISVSAPHQQRNSEHLWLHSCSGFLQRHHSYTGPVYE